MDAEILQKEIEAVQEGLLAVDEKVDELGEEQVQNTSEGTTDSSSTPLEPVIDLAQTVGRLEAEMSECRSKISDLELHLLRVETKADVASLPAEAEPETVTVAEVEVPEEPEPESEGGQKEARNPNWLERLLLVQ